MGMYTELVLKAEVREDAPEEVEAVLQYLFNRGPWPCPDKLPDHRFFTLPRWDQIGSQCSYYHVPWSTSKYSESQIFSRSDLKNYDSEIQEFISWLLPYLDEPEGQCIGWTWYEADSKPTLLFMP